MKGKEDNFKKVLKKAEQESISPQEALLILNEASTTQRLSMLFEVASRVRDENVGRVFKFDGFMGPITSCTIDPPCLYCSRAAKNKGEPFSDPLTIEEIKCGAKLIAESGTKRIELGGGTVLKGAGSRVINAVEAVKSVAPMLEIWLNFGPSFSRKDLLKLKELGVKEVCSSLEVYNPELFSEIKPGDSMTARKKLAGEINEVGLGLKSVMMVGVGSLYKDYIDYMFWLNNFKNLSHCPITGFNPIPGAPFGGKEVALSSEVAKVAAVARLVNRNVDISLGGIMNNPHLLPLWIMAGANRAIHMGVHVNRKSKFSWSKKLPEVITKTVGNIEYSNMLPLTERIVQSMGMDADINN